ncbi:MAG: T9SS type A sorting domain-containing protein [Bacteroidota bacterium]
MNRKYFDYTLPLLFLMVSFLSFGQEYQYTTREKIDLNVHACTYKPAPLPSEFFVDRAQYVKDRMEGRANPCSSFIVNYNGFTAEAQTAFQFAVEIWESELESSVPIRVNATFGPLPPGALGGASPDGYFSVTGPGIAPNTLFPSALAEKITGQDTDLFTGESNDINSTFSSTANFYFGTDGNTPPGLIDFVTVVLHELGHGLGIVGFGAVTTDGTQGFIRRNSSNGPGGEFFSVWDTFIDGTDILNNVTPILNEDAVFGFPDPSATMLAELEGGSLTCNSPIAVAQNGGIPPATFAPSTFNPGSSYSHWDEATFNGTQNALMTPQVAAGEAIHAPGEITLGFMEDMGWTLCNRSLSVPDVAFEGLQISPNPFIETITISLPSGLRNDNYDISIYDINGRIILDLEDETVNTNGELEISNLNNLEDAVYFLQLTNVSTGSQITNKVIKN